MLPGESNRRIRLKKVLSVFMTANCEPPAFARDAKRVRRFTYRVFLSGNGAHAEFRDGNIDELMIFARTVSLLFLKLIGMHSAVWIPLRDRGRTFGLAMVGYSRPPGPLDLVALRARADEISLAVQHHRSSRRSELASEELRAQSRLSRAILCGVSADSILPQIARAEGIMSRQNS